MTFIIFLHVQRMLRIDKAMYLSFLSKSLLYERLCISLWGSDVLLFSIFINIVSTPSYNFFEFIILLYTFLIIYFAPYKEYMICLISFSIFWDVLPAFTCESLIFLVFITWYYLKHLFRSERFKSLAFLLVINIESF